MNKTTKSKHRFSTYLLICIGIIIFVAAIGAFDTGDMEVLCRTDNAVLKRISGVWSCSNTNYAEGYFNSNNTNPYTISIDSTNIFYNLTEWQPSNYYGFSWNNNGVVVNKDGVYKLSGIMTYTGGNGGLYGFVLLKNGIPQSDCSAGHQSTNTLDDLTLNCLVTLTAGDYLNIAVRDTNNPTQDVDIYKANFNIVEVI